MDHNDEDRDGSERSRPSMTERLMERIRRYAPELEISREATEMEMRIGHHTTAEYEEFNQSLWDSQSDDKTDSNGAESTDSNAEVAAESVDRENRVTSTERMDRKEVKRDNVEEVELGQDEEAESGTTPLSPLMIDSKEQDTVDLDDRIDTKGVHDPYLNPLGSAELQVRVVGNRNFCLRQRTDPDADLISDSPESETTDENPELPKSQVTDSVKLTLSETNVNEVKSGQTTPLAWWNLWGIFRRTAKVYPSSIPQDIPAGAPESPPRIGRPASDPVLTEQGGNKNGPFVSLVDDADLVRHNIEDNPEPYRDLDEDDVGQNTEAIPEGEGGLNILEYEGRTDEPQILNLPEHSNPLEGSSETSSSAISQTSGHEHRQLAKDASANTSQPKAQRKKKSHRSKASSSARESSGRRKTQEVSVIPRDSLELAPSEVKVTDIVEALRKATEMEKGQVVPVKILFLTKPQSWIKGEESEEEPGLFDDEISMLKGGFIPPVLSDSIVGNFSDRSVRARGRKFFRKDFPVLGPDAEMKPPRSKWKSFFRKKKNNNDTVTKTTEKKSRDEAPARNTRTSWFGGLRRTVRERWNKLTRRNRASAAVAPAPIIPEEVINIDEVPEAGSSQFSTKSEPILGKSSKSEPNLGKSSKSKSKVKRWKSKDGQRLWVKS